MLIEARDAIFGYSGKPVVRAGELALRAGQCLGIFGPNGIGKTTLVRGLAGLIDPIGGEVIRRQLDLRLGYLPQQRAMELEWPMSALDAAGLAISARARLGWIGRHRPALRDSLKTLGVSDLSDLAFARLSGGQQQRVLLAGALACEPHLLVLDEPTDGLDIASRKHLLDLLDARVCAGLCVVIISHEIDALLEICDTIAWLHPPDQPDAPAHVELIAPEDFAQRMTHVQRASPLQRRHA